MRKPKISIITISFNNETDIEETLKSVVSQNYNNIEYIVIDGDSTDATQNIIEQYHKYIDTFVSEPDKGIYDAINKGLKRSTGDIVGLIHAGDRLFDDKVLSKVVRHFENNDIDASYGHSVLVNKEDKPVRVNKSPEFRKSLFKRGWMPSHQSIYLRRELLDKLGYYRLDFGGSGDYEFVLRYFYFNNLKVKRLDEFILKFALGGSSTTNYSRLFKRQNVHRECWVANGENPPFYMVPLKLLRKVPQFTRAIYSKTRS